ncbi:MAG: hypothetical protein ACR2NA_01165 [Solirubrobacterales bacterium]
MARKSLRSHLNQIRTWVRQGRTDAWIAHQLEVSATQLRDFKRQHELTGDGEDPGEVDLRDEIEAEIEAATVAEEAQAAEEAERRANEPDPEPEDEPEDEADDSEDAESDNGDDPEAKPRRRRRRRSGGRERKLEATFDHGDDEGYGLWLDASVRDNPVYTEHWAGHRKLTVKIEDDRIVLERADDQAS